MSMTLPIPACDGNDQEKMMLYRAVIDISKDEDLRYNVTRAIGRLSREMQPISVDTIEDSDAQAVSMIQEEMKRQLELGEVCVRTDLKNRYMMAVATVDRAGDRQRATIGMSEPDEWDRVEIERVGLFLNDERWQFAFKGTNWPQVVLYQLNPGSIPVGGIYRSEELRNSVTELFHSPLIGLVGSVVPFFPEDTRQIYVKAMIVDRVGVVNFDPSVLYGRIYDVETSEILVDRVNVAMTSICGYCGYPVLAEVYVCSGCDSVAYCCEEHMNLHSDFHTIGLCAILGKSRLDGFVVCDRDLSECKSLKPNTTSRP